MSGYTYYQYKDVKVNIAHRLFNMEGWTVYGYSADNSDPYTDYYDPAYWGGIATKNGYILCVDQYQAEKEYKREYTVYSEDNHENAEKIAKLEKMTQANGASASEEATAKAAIKKLQEKKKAGEVTKIDYRPGHMANPPRCNWHIEKDGIIIDKGTGLLKFASVPDISNSYELEKWQKFNNLTREDWIKETAADYMSRWNENEEEATRSAESAYNSAIETYKLLDKFNILLNRFNTVAGGMVGNTGENGYTYEVRKVTKYKKVYKFIPTESGSFKEGQCFQLKSSFNYGCFSGYVYMFKSCFDGQCVRGQRVSLKTNKIRTGTATASNSFGYYAADGAEETHGRDKEKFLKWIETGAIVWGEVIEVMEPYEVEKTFKVDADGNEYKPKKAEAPAAEENEINYIISEDIDTRDNSKIFVVKLSALASPEQFKTIREQMKTAGGYYSRFKRGFIFKEDPSQALNQAPQEETTEAVQETQPSGPAAEEITPEEKPEEIPTEAPQEHKKTVYGYNGESCEVFTPEQITELEQGKQITTGNGWRRAAFFAIDQQQRIKFVYAVTIGDCDKISPKTNPDFRGLLFNSRYFTDFDAIKTALREDVNTELMQQLPTQEAAERNAVELDKYDQDSLKFYYDNEFKKEAQTHYIDNSIPELILYSAMLEKITNNDIINYLLDPSAVVAEIAAAYKKTHRVEILKRYLEYNKTVTAYNAITADKTHPAHMLKRIKDATTDEAQKTYKIQLANGHTVKAEARAVRRAPYSGNIGSYFIAANDRQFLNIDQYGRPDDIKPDDIILIMHGAKVLYKKSA